MSLYFTVKASVVTSCSMLAGILKVNCPVPSLDEMSWSEIEKSETPKFTTKEKLNESSLVKATPSVLLTETVPETLSPGLYDSLSKLA